MNNPNRTPELAEKALPQSVLVRHKVSQTHLIYILLGVLLIYYVLLIPNGYGNHDDIYRMIGTWRTFLAEHRYLPSRFQGYLIPEIVIGISSQIGGFYLSNLVSAVLSIASLFFFYRLLICITVPSIALLATAAVGTNPYWIIASTTSTDYVYPAFFFLFGLFLLFQDKLRIAGILFALTVSSRITYGPMAVIAFAFYAPYLKQQQELRQRFFQAVVLFLVGSALLYLPVFIASGMTFSFLGFASETSGGTFGVIARFLYKNIYLWGLPAFVVLLVFIFKQRHFYWQKLCSNILYNTQVKKLLFHAVFWCFLYNELLFARLPHQYQYLIPVLFCVIYFIAIVPFSKQQFICLSLIFALHLVYAVANLDVLETYQTTGVNQTIHSDGARAKLHFDNGVLVRDFKWRSIYQRNLTERFNQQWQNKGFEPLDNPR